MHISILMASIFFKLPILLAYPFTKQFGEICDWRGQTDNCDQSRGLTCHFSSSTCSCWDTRKIYSQKIHRCAGKAGEECVYFESERLCTENAYCLEDQTFSPIPLCMCLKGYFRSDNGTCVKYSKLGESCQLYTSRQACEPESGLRCSSHFKCECEPDQLYDPVKELCIAKAGQRCSRTLNNCIENADCFEKMWAYDYESGETKIIGYRCGCNPGLKITHDGLCASDYGGNCNKTSDCYSGENLSCLNGMCQCHPLSQIYDKKARSCFNLVGTKCHLPIEQESQNNNISSKEKLNNSSTKKEFVLKGNGIKNEDDFISSSQTSSTGMETADCIANAQCVSTVQGNMCKCINGSSETLIKTCLFDYGQECQSQNQQMQMQSEQRSFILLERPKELEHQDMKCNVFEGLICHSDLGKCLCADPSLVYDNKVKACVSTNGNPCGNVKLDLLDLDENFKNMIFINCVTNSSCVEKNINGKFKRVCIPTPIQNPTYSPPNFYRGSGTDFNIGNNNNNGGTGNGSSLSKIMFNNSNVIHDSE